MQGFSGDVSSRGRALALSLVGCALVILLIGMVTTSHAFVTTIGEDTLEDFASGEFYRTSLLEIPPDVDSIQLVPIGLSGEWGMEPHSLPIALTELAAVAGRSADASKGHVMVMGGFDRDHHYHDEVYVSAINDDGSLNGWIEQTSAPLPQALAAAAAAIYPRDANSSWVYLLGGTAGGDALDTVYYTVLNHATGTISPWTTEPDPMYLPLYYHAVAAHNGYLYVVGGYWVEAGWAPEAVGTVYYAKIEANGSLGPWIEAESLPTLSGETEETPISSHLLVSYGEGDVNTLYAVGGWDRTGGPANSSFQVFFADINPADGSLSPWKVSKGSLPNQIYAHSGAQVNGQILVTGGRDANNTISDTVKAALIDPTDNDFRLYDWCESEPPPTCTIGAWQTGPILPEARAFHVTVDDGGYIYTLGGVGSNGEPSNVVFWGSINELADKYSPWGRYVSSEIDFGSPSTLRQVEWGATLAYPAQMTLKLSYRYRLQGGTWQPWSAPVDSTGGTNLLVLDPPLENVRIFQYRVDLTTELDNSSPLLDWIDIYYEVDDPDLEVSKNSGAIISVTQGTHLDYTIYYTNSGEWTAENAVLTETLPLNTIYDGGPEWQRVGTSRSYTYALGDVAPGSTGNVPFRTRVISPLPLEIEEILNTVQINYPPMLDALMQKITDPQLDDNEAEWINPVAAIGLDIKKDSVPPPNTVVQPGSLITYTLYYTNVGKVLAVETVLTDTFDLEGDYTIVSADPPPDEGNNIWHLGALAGRASGKVEIVVQVNDPLPNGWELTNQAVLYSPIDKAYWSEVLTHTVMNTIGPEPVAMVDLVAKGLRWEPARPAAGTAVRFYGSINNEGDKAADSPFWAEVYIKPAPSQPPTRPADHEMGFCVGAVCDRYSFLVRPAGLPAEAGAELVFQGPGLSFPEECRVYDIYLQVDVADVPNDNAYWGHYAEADESNNLIHLAYLTPCGPEGPPKAFLPIITRGAK